MANVHAYISAGQKSCHLSMVRMMITVIMMIMVRMMVIIMAREAGVENKSDSKLLGVGVSIRIIKSITQSN